MKTPVDILIKNGQILTINAWMEVIEGGVVAISGTTIVDVGDASLIDQYAARQVIDAQGGIVMPGMVNTHGHLPMIAFRGLGEEGIADRLMGYFMPLEKAMLSRQLIYDATTHGAIDMAFSGVTTYADMYYHVDEMARATAQVGLRAVLGQTVIGFPVVDAPIAYGGLDYARQILPEFAHNELVSLALAPHAPYTVSKEKLLEVSTLAYEHDLLIHIHAAEFAGEQHRITDNIGGLSVIQYLDDIGFLDRNVLLAHCSHTDAVDLETIRVRGARIAHNPMANAKGATGAAHLVEALAARIPVGLGTDGPMGSNGVDLFAVMSYAANIQRLRKMDGTLMPPSAVVRLATLGGAEALGLQQQIGSLERGKRADIIVVETQSMNMIPNHDPYATLVFQANPHNVQNTLVNGRILVENRELKTYDLAQNRHCMAQWYQKIKPLGQRLAKAAQQTNRTE